jgi:hypothetical protein
MASTFSDLKFELIGTGDQSGTWGITTNDNIGVAIEDAITGSADVTFASADVTVTLTDTVAAQTARNLRLNLTGTTGGARNLILGSGCQIEKLYLINNGTADIITVKNTTGTGIAVPAGKSMFVYNDATNVVDATTHLSSLTLGTALPITSGGTGSTSTTFVNLASNVTGTLPIANGGTGTTSTTFVNLASNVTGTLPIANGGTGSTSTTFVDLASNVTGQLPLSNGGTGANLTDPNADRILFWDDSATSVAFLEAGSGLSISGTTISATASFATPLTVVGNATAGSEIRLPEDTDNGSNYVAIKAPDAVTSNRTVNLPDADTNVPIASQQLTFSGPTAARTYTLPDATTSLGYINIPQSGSAKTTAYTLATSDVGEFIEVGSGGSIEIPDATFSAGDAILVFNNTASGITITCTITTAYIAGTDADKATMTLATRGIASILFVSGTVCVISGNVS